MFRGANQLVSKSERKSELVCLREKKRDEKRKKVERFETRKRERREEEGNKRSKARRDEKERKRAVSGPEGESDWVVSRGDR